MADEAEAVAVARQYLGYFAGPSDEWSCADQAALRDVIPENRRQVYDVRTVIHALRRHRFGARAAQPASAWGWSPPSLASRDGRSASSPTTPRTSPVPSTPTRADKAARFLTLCDAHDVPLLFLCDTPGIMVGPEAETTALVRHASRLFVVGASLTVPFGTIVLRKGYGLGAQAMAGGSFKAPLFCVSWPTGEFGGMGLEGAVRLGYRKELEAIEDDDERERGLRGDGRPDVPGREGRQRRQPLRARRRHRPRRLAPMDHHDAGLGPAATAAHGQEASMRRHVVSQR